MYLPYLSRNNLLNFLGPIKSKYSSNKFLNSYSDIKYCWKYPNSQVFLTLNNPVFFSVEHPFCYEYTKHLVSKVAFSNRVNFYCRHIHKNQRERVDIIWVNFWKLQTISNEKALSFLSCKGETHKDSKWELWNIAIKKVKVIKSLMISS